jgi:BASS family bile acid:Na+ symporter
MKERVIWIIAGASLALSLVGWMLGIRDLTAPAMTMAFASVAVAFQIRPRMRTYAFSVWVLAFVALSIGYPSAFQSWFGVDLTVFIVPLIQVIMFGMGTTLSLVDFARVLKMPWPVLVGIVLQFSVMPTLGWLLSSGLGFESQVAAGIVLVGAAPGGVASNLMTYLARGNVALSVTMTACSTLLAPLMTPLLMKFFASQYIEVNVIDMMLSICNMIIVPIVAGLLANRILYSARPPFHQPATLVGLSLILFAVAAICFRFGGSLFGPLTVGVALGLCLLGAVALSKWIVELLLDGPKDWMDRALPALSMISICCVIAIITSRSAKDLLEVGWLLFLAAVLHNLGGYVLGYWFARLLGLKESDCRTVAIEVGLQNAGMASGLAIHTLKSTQAALAPAIFGPWMNVSGSMLASYWRARPPADEEPRRRGTEAVPLEHDLAPESSSDSWNPL